MDKPVSIDQHNLERIKEIEVRVVGTNYEIKVGDLKEILFRMNNASKVTVGSSLVYALLIHTGIQLKGFVPNKTALRNCGLSLEEINKILPGSYPSVE